MRKERKAAGEFRRLTEYDLRAGKVADADAVLAATPADGGRIVLDTGTAECWVRAINDVRLALGTRLGLTENNMGDFERRHHDDPLRQPLRASTAGCRICRKRSWTLS